ncbi:hypothetical protein B9T33_07930 [Acinetobacter sp. ANC 5054]|uniref:DUF4303 domain-containing protein n=1 Tax=Acinetobacter sp. ANC 5054 TaxID=1977877 RepID=UPI000A34D645|nr:DUF4303 domain-containing protein [Acinetobacter sp. ANC 5054]OTG80898.1 hypothetical protein B9T33_07930 [Acinetobacter sp. ANC 5054]
MLNHISVLKDVLIEEFLKLYEQHSHDHIYACALVFNKFLLVDYFTISTTRSIFAEEEDASQYLAENDRWNVQKWRYRTMPTLENGLAQFKFILSDYLNHQQPNTVSDTQHTNAAQNHHLDLLLTAFQQAQLALVESHELNIKDILFFISIPTQPEIEIYSAQFLNEDHPQLQDFLQHKQPLDLSSIPKRMKLTQNDKDMLIDLAQLVEIEPYNYLHVANEAYVLSLENSYTNTNPYIQKLVQSIIAMTTDPKGTFAMDKDEILSRINQFYHNATISADALYN